MKKFIINGQYRQLLTQYGFNVEKVLKAAKLPENLFTHEQIRLTEQEYYHLMDTIAKQAPNPQTLITLATYDDIETFSAPILAAYCSENGMKFIERLGQYKPLIGPIGYQIRTEREAVTVTLKSLNALSITSKFYTVSELLFLINLITKATEENVVPLKITTTFPDIAQPISAALKVNPTVGEVDSITFKLADLERPFLTDNAALRSYLTPELKRRLAELEVDESFSAQVRSALVDLLPAGESTIEDVAGKLNVSKRTLQRKLKNEATSFQKQLNGVRGVCQESCVNSSLYD
ncbi:AraC family transcriptional regulator ligand-binding domain-containing protein [Levilactobacillus zymae]|uniref:AraC family transcriptional regulator ligand-binding domain-containing protein n=1 Tax=Levilactobacillus zymae TaxID=267363 RepID=UPI0028BCE949|nr:AraC family transcriptional regulator ligand-binding domain-containing protein [Levilactobacillus zymae]MDT6979812.1 AraC family transcriptional regulator ligand-binding domain-containing protein [Levilactobacillus zymae]